MHKDDNVKPTPTFHFLGSRLAGVIHACSEQVKTTQSIAANDALQCKYSHALLLNRINYIWPQDAPAGGGGGGMSSRSLLLLAGGGGGGGCLSLLPSMLVTTALRLKRPASTFNIDSQLLTATLSS